MQLCSGPRQIADHERPSYMQDSQSTGAANKSDLIESIYRIALEPQTYDSFMGHWDVFILEQIAKLNDLAADATSTDHTVSDAEITNHFAIAMQLLEQAGRPETQESDDRPRARVPQMMFNGAGVLMWHNNLARDLFGARVGAGLASFEMDESHRREVEALLGSNSTAGVVIARLKPACTAKPIPMAFKLSNSASSERLFMATQVRQSWPQNTGPLLAGGFGLSVSEIDICAFLVDGHSPADIAAARNRALGTVRTQIKKILHKTDTSGQVELVSLLHATMQLASQNATATLPDGKIPDSVLNIKLTDRLMPVETFGDPDGTPVIFFHGMLDGNSMTDRLRSLLKARGFYLICPMRPSFGTAPPDRRGTVADAPLQLAADIEILLETTGARRPILLGHMAGVVYAFAAARHLGARIRGVLSVAGGVPMTSAAQFSSMSVRQRVVALTARYTPRVLPFVIRAGINQLDNAGERQFIQSLYQYSPCDLREIANPEIRDIILSGYRFTVAQGHRAFEVDSYHVVRDWSTFVDQSDCPIEVLHGAHDPVVSIKSVEQFYEKRSARARITRLDDTGQLLLYKNPDIVVETLERLRSSPLP
jgi:pimeloyl-ACP methyl ester carboxylesterase/DNA-binding CsgD family transcriptional regulator